MTTRRIFHEKQDKVQPDQSLSRTGEGKQRSRKRPHFSIKRGKRRQPKKSCRRRITDLTNHLVWSHGLFSTYKSGFEQKVSDKIEIVTSVA